MRHLPRRAAYRKSNQPNRRHMFQATKTGGAKQSTLFKTLVPDISYWVTRLNVFSAERWFCFGLIFCHYAKFFPFAVVRCILCHCMSEVCNLPFDFAGD